MRVSLIRKCTPGNSRELTGVAGRGWLYLFTGAATFIGIQLLYLANDDMTLNVALSVAVICGFVFSYYMDAAYQRFTVIVLDIVAIAVFFYYLNKIKEYSSAWGTDFGTLLGILIALYSFRAYSDRDHRTILAACLVIMLLASVASYDVKLMFILPFFVFAAFASLYVANSISLSERIPYLASAMSAGRTIIYLAGRTTAAVLVVSILIYMIVPHSAGLKNPRFRLPKGNVVADEDLKELDTATLESMQKPNNFSGFSKEFDLSGGKIELRDDPVLLVRGTLNDYLRGKVFDVYNGRGWTQDEAYWKRKYLPDFDETQKSELAHKFPNDVGGDVSFLPLVDFPSEEMEKTLAAKNIYVMLGNRFSSYSNPELKYSTQPIDVVFLRNDLPIFFSPYQPYRIEDITRTSKRTEYQSEPLPFADPVSDAYSVVNAAGNYRQYFPKGMEYKLFVLKPAFLPSKLAESPSLRFSTGNDPHDKQAKIIVGNEEVVHFGSEEILHYTQLPDVVNKNNALVQLAKVVALGSRDKPAATVYDKVTNVYDYFVNSGEFTYSLDYPKLPAGEKVLDPESSTNAETPVDAAAHFVLTTKRGYCEYFANAFAVFLRINGIPARIVTGYSPGSYSFLQNGYVVSSKNAHSWVEVYFDGFGWVGFDPTPASSDLMSAGQLRSFFAGSFDFVQNLFVVDPRGVQQAIVSFFALLSRRLIAVAIDNTVTSSLILLGLFGILFYYWWRRRPKPAPQHVPKNDVVGAYYRIESALSGAGFGRNPSTTVRAYLKVTSGILPPISPALLEFADLFYTYAYGASAPGAVDVERAERLAGAVATHFEEEKKKDASGKTADR